MEQQDKKELKKQKKEQEKIIKIQEKVRKEKEKKEKKEKEKQEKLMKKQKKNQDKNSKTLYEKKETYTYQMYLDIKEKLKIEVDDDLLTNTALAKLQYLEAFIENKDQNTMKLAQSQLMKLLEKQQYETYINFTPNQKLEKYMNIVYKILLHHDNFNYLYDQIEVQGQTLKMWRNRDVKLDRQRGYLILNYNDNDNKIEKIYLITYQVLWKGIKGNKFYYHLKSMAQANKYQTIKFRNNDERTAKKWYQAINKAISDIAKKEQRKSSFLGKEQFSQQHKNRISMVNGSPNYSFSNMSQQQISKSFVEQSYNRKSEQVNYVYQKQHLQNSNQKSARSTSQNNMPKYSIIEDNIQGQSQRNSRIQSQVRSQSPLRPSLPITMQNFNYDQYKVTEKNKKALENLEKSQNSINKKLQEQIQQQSLKQQEIQLQQQHLFVPNSIIDLNSESANQSEVKQVKTSQISNEQQENTDIDYDDDDFYDMIEAKVVDEENDEFKKDDEFMENLQNEEDFQLIYSSHNIRILQNTENKNNLKLKLTHNSSSFKLLNILNSFDLFKNWNMEISQIEVLKIFSDSMIVYQQNIPYGLSYRNRQIIFRREFKMFPKAYLMCDTSVDFDFKNTFYNLPNKRSQTAQLKHANWGFFYEIEGQEVGSNLMVLDIELYNQGYIKQSTNVEMTLNLIKQYQNLQTYCEQQIKQPNNFILRNFNIYPENQGEKQIFKQIQEFVKNQQNFQQQFIDVMKKSYDKKNSLTGSNLQEVLGLDDCQVSEQVFKSFNSNENTLKASLIEQTQEKNKSNLQIIQEENQEKNNNINQETVKNNIQNEQIVSFSNKNNEIKSLNQQEEIINQNITNQQQNQQYNSELYQIFNKIDNIYIKKKQLEKEEYNKLIMRRYELIEKNMHWNECLNNKFKMNYEPYQQNQEEYEEIHPGIELLRQDFVRDNKKGALHFINKEKEKLAKKVVSYILKKAGKKIFTGQSIIGMSLPVFMFDKTSNLERNATGFGYAPIYFEKAGQVTDPVEQMKLVCTSQIAGVSLQMNMVKPFNPILGETFQGSIDGCPVYYEQISHHPPIFCFQVYGRNYNFTGSQETIASMNANSVTASNLGLLKVTLFNTQNIITIASGGITIEGTLVGDRYFNCYGKQYCWDLKNDLFCEVIFQVDKSQGMFSKSVFRGEDYFVGGIYRVNQHFKDRFSKIGEKIYDNKGKLLFQGLNLKKDIDQQIASCEGIWHKYIKFNDIETWNIDKIIPYKLKKDPFSIPSDCNYRRDATIWKTDNVEQSQIVKEEMEISQRQDRKLREKYMKEQQKLHKKKK